MLCTSLHAARGDCGGLLKPASRPDTHAITNIEVCLQNNWPADRQKTCYHAALTSSEIDSDTHKIFWQYVYASLPGAPIASQPTLDFERLWVNMHMQMQ